MSEFYTYVKYCPKCNGMTAVRDSRETEDGSITRRRECVDCGYKYNTVEVEEYRCDTRHLYTQIDKLKTQINELSIAHANAIQKIRDIKAIIGGY